MSELCFSAIIIRIWCVASVNQQCLCFCVVGEAVCLFSKVVSFKKNIFLFTWTLYKQLNHCCALVYGELWFCTVIFSAVSLSCSWWDSAGGTAGSVSLGHIVLSCSPMPARFLKCNIEAIMTWGKTGGGKKVNRVGAQTSDTFVVQIIALLQFCLWNSREEKCVCKNQASHLSR